MSKLSETIDPGVIEQVISTAIKEDLAYGPDITSQAIIAPGQRSEGKIVARESGVIVGGEVVELVLQHVATNPFQVTVLVADGQRVTPGTTVAKIAAGTADLLTAERTILNILTHLCGIATATAAWVDEVAGTSAVIRDSRKTLPGLRQLEKYAVKAGGGHNHRMGLGDQAMIKDNHVIAAGGVRQALELVRKYYPHHWCEVEVDSLEQLEEILPEAPSQVLLDNFSVADVSSAVQLRNQLSPETLLEASGGLTIDRAKEYASQGVDSLAVGGLTHSVKALDLGLDFS